MEPVVVWRRAAKSGPHTPLVLLLHGRGADEHDLLDIADRLPRAFNYASVRAPIVVEGGGFTWFEDRGVGRPIGSSVRSSASMLRAWLDGSAVTPLAGRCYILGFSAGMMMAGALLLSEPKRFAGAVLLSGALALHDADRASAGALRGTPVFYARGMLDDVIPATLVAQTETYLRSESGADLTERLYRHAHSISTREVADIAAWFEQHP